MVEKFCECLVLYPGGSFPRILPKRPHPHITCTRTRAYVIHTHAHVYTHDARPCRCTSHAFLYIFQAYKENLWFSTSVPKILMTLPLAIFPTTCHIKGVSNKSPKTQKLTPCPTYHASANNCLHRQASSMTPSNTCLQTWQIWMRPNEFVSAPQ